MVTRCAALGSARGLTPRVVWEQWKISVWKWHMNFAGSVRFELKNFDRLHVADKKCRR